MPIVTCTLYYTLVNRVDLMFSVLTTIFKKEKKAIRKPLNQSSVRRDAKEEMDREVDQGDGTSQLTG